LRTSARLNSGTDPVERKRVDEVSDRLLQVISEFEDIAEKVTPDETARIAEESTLQLFWRQWPFVSSWAGSLWRLLNEDIADSATSPTDDFHEVGGGD
jgi:hypothetical protein